MIPYIYLTQCHPQPRFRRDHKAPVRKFHEGFSTEYRLAPQSSIPDRPDAETDRTYRTHVETFVPSPHRFQPDRPNGPISTGVISTFQFTPLSCSGIGIERRLSIIIAGARELPHQSRGYGHSTRRRRRPFRRQGDLVPATSRMVSSTLSTMLSATTTSTCTI